MSDNITLRQTTIDDLNTMLKGAREFQTLAKIDTGLAADRLKDANDRLRGADRLDQNNAAAVAEHGRAASSLASKKSEETAATDASDAIEMTLSVAIATLEIAK